MGVIMESLLQSAVSDSLRKGESLEIGISNLGDLRGRILESAAAFHGETRQVREAIAEQVRKVANVPLRKGELRVGMKVRHRGSGVEGTLGRLGDGYAEIWCSGGGISRWPIDELVAVDEEAPVMFPGGSQGSYAGEPEAQKVQNFLVSPEGQFLLSKSIRPIDGARQTSAGFKKRKRAEAIPGMGEEPVEGHSAFAGDPTPASSHHHLKIERSPNGSLKSITLL